jgi:hypothetical protein
MVTKVRDEATPEAPEEGYERHRLALHDRRTEAETRAESSVQKGDRSSLGVISQILFGALLLVMPIFLAVALVEGIDETWPVLVPLALLCCWMVGRLFEMTLSELFPLPPPKD